MSRGFYIMLAGVAITLLGYLGYADWAARPAYLATRLLFGDDPSRADDLDPMERLFLIVGLLHVNVGVWAFILWLAVKVVRPDEEEAGA